MPNEMMDSGSVQQSQLISQEEKQSYISYVPGGQNTIYEVLWDLRCKPADLAFSLEIH